MTPEDRNTLSAAREKPPEPRGSGRHMIEGFRLLAASARAQKGNYREMADVYETAALCIENEARRADIAEWRLAQLELGEVA